MLLPKVPRGLLEIVRARAQGQAPNQLADSIAGVIDTTAMYGSDLITGQTTLGAAGSITRTIVAQMTALTGPGRMLGVSLSCVVGAAAGTQIRLAIGVRHNTGAGDQWLASTLITAPVAGAAYVLPFWYPYPHVYAVGASWIALTGGDAAGADHTFTLHQLFENYSALIG